MVYHFSEVEDRIKSLPPVAAFKKQSTIPSVSYCRKNGQQYKTCELRRVKEDDNMTSTVALKVRTIDMHSNISHSQMFYPENMLSKVQQ